MKERDASPLGLLEISNLNLSIFSQNKNQNRRNGELPALNHDKSQNSKDYKLYNSFITKSPNGKKKIQSKHKTTRPSLKALKKQAEKDVDEDHVEAIISKLALAKSPSQAVANSPSRMLGSVMSDKNKHGRSQLLLFPTQESDPQYDLPPGINFERKMIQRNSLTSLLKAEETDDPRKL